MNLERAKQILKVEVSALQNLENQLDEALLDCVNTLKNTKGNILVCGMGTSGSVARRAAHLLGCCGQRAFFVHPSDQQHGASGAISASDTIVVFSKGGESLEINTFLQMCKDKGCKLVAITGTKESTMARLADCQLVITIPKESEPFGMLATTSSLAAGLATDLICVLLLDETGYTKDQFGKTHPGGAVGLRVRTNQS